MAWDTWNEPRLSLSFNVESRNCNKTMSNIKESLMWWVFFTIPEISSWKTSKNQWCLQNLCCMTLKSWSLNSPDLYEFPGLRCVGPGSRNLTARPHDGDAISWWMMVEHNHLETEKTNDCQWFLSWVTGCEEDWASWLNILPPHATWWTCCHLSLWKIKVIGEGIGLTL